MSCLNLMSLLPRKKVWKLFTTATKLPLKLHKFNKSKAIKKHKNQYSYKSTPKKLGWPSLSIQPKKFKNKKTKPRSTLLHHHNHQQNHRYYKRPPPVFVDQLFIEPSSKERVYPPGVVSATPEIKDIKEKSCPSGSSSKRSTTKSWPLGSDQILDRKVTVPPPESWDGETSCGVDEESMVSADDMWESMVMASPQLVDGINERAEQFIAQFRADMHKQELQLGRRL